MVFSRVDHRKHLSRPRLASANLDGLPDELLYLILEDLPTNDLLNARATCSNLTPVCNSLIAEKNARLYIHPTTTSLRNAVKVCQCPIWASGITEVVLLGHMMWSEIFHYFAGDCIHSSPNNPIFRHWPRCGFTSHKGQVLTQTSSRVFEKVYADLINAIALLPNVRKLSFAHDVQQPGFNQVSLSQLLTYARKCAVPGSVTTGDSFSDLEAFFGILFSAPLQFTEVSLDTMMPFIRDTETLWNLPPGLSTHNSNVLEQLKKIELVFDYQYQLAPLTAHYKNLLHYATSLQDLRVELHHVEAHKKRWPRHRMYVNVLDQLLLSMTFLQLEKLTIIQRPPRNYKGEDPTPPLLQHFNLASFLESHRSTIRHVHIDNVVFAYPGTPSIPGHEMTRLILDKMIELRPRLGHVVWLVARSEHHLKCDKIHDASRGWWFHIYCGVYSGAPYNAPPTPHCRSTVNDFMELAHSNWVYEDPRTKYWDFGIAVICADAIRERKEGMA